MECRGHFLVIVNMFLMFMDVCLYFFLGIISTNCPYWPKDRVKFPEIGVTDGCVLPCGCRDSNLIPLEEQPLL